MTYKTGNVVITRDSTLKHHGILGQKWGDRNGPPYPLGASDHSASEKKAGWRKSLSADKLLNRTMKQGKNKPNISPLEKNIKDAKDINYNVKDISNSASETLSKKNYFNEKNDAKKLTDKELNDAVKRMELEKRYADLKTQDYSNEADKVSKILNYSGDILAIALSAASLAATIYSLKNK